MTGVSLVAVNLATICLESFFYGIFFVLALAFIYILAHRNSHSDLLAPPRSWIQALRSIITSPMLLAAAAFLYYEGGTKPTQFYGDLSQKTYIAQLSALAFCIILGDAILVYRLWIVWAYRKTVIMIPICSLIGLVVCNIGVTYQTSRFRPGDNVNQVSAVAWITPLWAFTICTDPHASLDRMARLEGAFKISKSFRSRNLMLQSELQFNANQTTPGICGIAFMLIKGSEATADDRPHEANRFPYHSCSLASIKKHADQYRCEGERASLVEPACRGSSPASLTQLVIKGIAAHRNYTTNSHPANEVTIFYDGGTIPRSLDFRDLINCSRKLGLFWTSL
ncbi:predicted protein [Postia placenta Mad-698-R]|nr:predicted protein [Postia placenta Mad-698-R]